MRSKYRIRNSGNAKERKPIDQFCRTIKDRLSQPPQCSHFDSAKECSLHEAKARTVVFDGPD